MWMSGSESDGVGVVIVLAVTVRAKVGLELGGAGGVEMWKVGVTTAVHTSGGFNVRDRKLMERNIHLYTCAFPFVCT